jgi:hypothetical protein
VGWEAPAEASRSEVVGCEEASEEVAPGEPVQLCCNYNACWGFYTRGWRPARRSAGATGWLTACVEAGDVGVISL